MHAPRVAARSAVQGAPTGCQHLGLTLTLACTPSIPQAGESTRAFTFSLTAPEPAPPLAIAPAKGKQPAPPPPRPPPTKSAPLVPGLDDDLADPMADYLDDGDADLSESEGAAGGARGEGTISKQERRERKAREKERRKVSELHGAPVCVLLCHTSCSWCDLRNACMRIQTSNPNPNPNPNPTCT